MKYSVYCSWLYGFALPAFANTQATEESSSMLLIKTVAALIAVVGMLFFLSWVVKKTPMLKQHQAGMKMTGSLSLGPKERIVLVEVGNKTLLLGVTASHISLLNTESLQTPTPPESCP